MHNCYGKIENFVFLPAPAAVPVLPSPTRKKKYAYKKKKLLESKSHFIKQGNLQYVVGYMWKYLYPKKN